MVPPLPIRRPPSEQLDLFRPLPDRPTWDQLPPPSRDEVRRLLVQLFVACGTGSVAAAEREADHE
jgi:hypothetical protein